jgi:hypothetical protein
MKKHINDENNGNNGKIIPFYGHSKNKENSCYSQFYDSKFTFKKSLVNKELLTKFEKLLDKIEYHMDLDSVENRLFFCAEQFMMLGKVLLFNPENLNDYFATCKNNQQCKKYGRSRQKISKFDEKVWTTMNLPWVAIGNYLKFSQNKELKNTLKSTKNAILVEASPYDKIWGVGIGVNDPDIWDMSKWKGQNKLGKALMAVRDLL